MGVAGPILVDCGPILKLEMEPSYAEGAPLHGLRLSKIGHYLADNVLYIRLSELTAAVNKKEKEGVPNTVCKKSGKSRNSARMRNGGYR
jgi:hypothetical protein